MPEMTEKNSAAEDEQREIGNRRLQKDFMYGFAHLVGCRWCLRHVRHQKQAPSVDRRFTTTTRAKISPHVVEVSLRATN